LESRKKVDLIEMSSNDNDFDTMEILPAAVLKLPVEMLHEIFNYLPHRQVFKVMPLVCQDWKKASQLYSVYLEDANLRSPTAEVMGSIYFPLIFSFAGNNYKCA
jgi:hypothetical protein